MLTLHTIVLYFHSIWLNTFFYLFAFMTSVLFIFAFYMSMMMKKKNSIIANMQQQHTDKIDLIRGDHSDTLERIRIEMLKREGERTRQWIESEKETLRVLNGVSILLDLGGKIAKDESSKIIRKLEEIQCKVEKITEKE